MGRGYLLVLAPDWFSVCAVICPVLPRCCARAWRTADRLRRVGRLAPERSAVLFRRHARFADRRQHRHHTEHDLKPPGRRGDQIGCCSATPKRLLDVEQVRVRICRKHLGHNGGDNADIMGAVGKLQGVTVLDGKRHGWSIAPRAYQLQDVLDRIGDCMRRRGSAGLAQLLNRFQPVPESAIYGADFSWRDPSRGYVAQYSALKHCDLV